MLRRAVDVEVEGQRKKWRQKRTWRKQVEEESVKVGLRREDTLLRLPNRCRPLRGWKTRPEKERRGRPNRHHSIPAPRERGLIQPFFR